ncbi:hypothetical protein C8F04DRAFT_671101 [Mycena alexandri]|uniref:Transmembrane protein n=1 Tax=Mycena alexandri TaxID=1745969 RepID=A0AAD6ST30_9AGAR|nr:hypothetical protein C8F04DRAFT_671101 [Mycena alexandri]
MLSSLVGHSLPAQNDVRSPGPWPGTGHRLPQDVEDVRQNFITTAQAMAVVTTLFAAIQAQFSSAALSEATSIVVVRVVLLVSYGSLLVNIGAASFAMVFLDIIGEAPERFRRWRTKVDASGTHPPLAARRTASVTNSSMAGSELFLLHGSPRSLQFAWYHCVASTLLGTVCVLLQITLLAWINISPYGSNLFAGIVLVLFWAALPLPEYLIYQFHVNLVVGFQRGLDG